MKKTIKLLQDYGEYKVGKLFTADAEDADTLIEDGIAEVYTPVISLKEANEIAEKSLADFEAQCKASLAKAMPRVEMVKDEADKLPFKSAGDFFQKVWLAGTGKSTEAMRAYVQKAPSGMAEIVDSDGGFLVPDDYSTLLMSAMQEQALIANRTTQIPINKTITFPFVRDNDKSTSFAGGVIAYWVAEGASITGSKVELQMCRLALKKLAALCYVTDELMEDSAVAVEALVMQRAGQAIAEMFDDAIINGTGAGTPLGMVNCPAKIAVAKEGGQAAATFNYQNALKMWGRINNKSKAVWLMNRDVMQQYYQFAQVVGTGGAPVTVINAVQRLPETLFGAPIIEHQSCQTLGTAGDVILCDPTQYITAIKAGGGIKSASSIHVKFTTDETTLRFIFRGDGQCWWNAATTPKNGSNTVSPIVTLAVRS